MPRITNLGTGNISAAGVLIPSGVGGTGTIDSSQTDGLTFQLGGSWVGTVAPEGSFDGINWDKLVTVFWDSSSVNNVTGNGIYLVHTITPFTRLRCTAWTSGQIQLLGGATRVDFTR